jgi:hypothetical protein
MGRQIQIGIDGEEEEFAWCFDPPQPKAGALLVAEAIQRSNGEERSWKNSLWLPGTNGDKSELIKALASVVCVSAVRGGTVHTFPNPDDPNFLYADVGSEGEYAPWLYTRRADDEVDESRRHQTESAPNLRRQLDAHLNELFPGAQANAEEIEGTSLVRLDLRLGTASDWNKPANMGYGVTYAFPVLIALLLAQRGGILVLDSPEAHLHPRAQSLMGQMLSRFAAAGVQLLVETHSDHVLNGVRLGVRRRLIKAENVAIHFFGGIDDTGAHGVISPRVDADGAIDAWPKGFFDQSEEDLAVLAGWA